ncbi:MAG: SDR family NAD(P)-dependent oxidoreductase [Pseudomonadota bacterium]
MDGTSQKVYWITGASSGIGREIALQLASLRHKVYISARSQSKLDALAEAAPGLLIPLPCDVSDATQVAGLFEKLTPKPEFLNGIILCAGTCEYIDVDDLDVGSVQRVMASNFFGVVHACKAALPLLRAGYENNPSIRPEIMGICSMSTYTGFPRAEAYGASKAAMKYFLEALRCDVQHEIAVTIVYPGFVATPMTQQNDFPMPFMLPVSKAAGYVVESLGKGKRSISFPWQLHVLLTLAAHLPGLWYGKVVTRLTRQRGTQA